MKKKLVFHFYCDDGWADNPATRLHFLCINYYQYIFDEITIVISTDSIKNKPFLAEIKRFIVNMVDCSNLTIKVAKNSVFREGKTFYDEVVEKDFDGIVFFAHSKGYTNFLDPEINGEKIVEWIVGAYWLSLNFPSEVEQKLSLSTRENNSIFFGAYTMSYNGEVLANSVYSGSFYWSNMAVVKRRLMFADKKLPSIGSRMYAEEFPGVVCLELGENLFESHNSIRLKGQYFNFYGKDDKLSAEDGTNEICYHGNHEEFKEYAKFKEKIMKRFTDPEFTVSSIAD